MAKARNVTLNAQLGRPHQLEGVEPVAVPNHQPDVYILRWLLPSFIAWDCDPPNFARQEAGEAVGAGHAVVQAILATT